MPFLVLVHKILTQSSTLSICPFNRENFQGLQGGVATRWKVPMSLSQSFKKSYPEKVSDKEKPCSTGVKIKMIVKPLKCGCY